MDNFNKILLELFDKSLKYKWTTLNNEEWTAEFKKGKSKFEVIIRKGRGKWWAIDFGVQETSGGVDFNLTGKGTKDAFAIYATVFAASREFVAEMKPEFISASAFDPRTVEVYNKFGKKFNFPGYTLTQAVLGVLKWKKNG